MVAAGGTGVDAATYDPDPEDDWISIIGYDPGQPGPLAVLQTGDEVILHEGIYTQPASNFKLRLYHQGTKDV